MSNNETNTDSTPWGDQEWALPLGADLLNQKNTIGLSAEEARNAIRDRIMGLFPAEGGTGGLYDSVDNREFATRMAEQIVQGLPADANVDRVAGGKIDQGIVNALDLRPYVQLVVDNPQRTFKVEVARGRDQYETIGPDRAMEVWNALGAVADDIATTTAAGAGVAKEEVAFSTTEVGMSPEARLSTAQQSGTVNPESVFSGSGYDDVADRPVWNEDDAIRITQMPSSVFDTAIAYENSFNEQAGTPDMQRGGIILETGVEPDRISVNRDDGRRFPQRQPGAQNKVLSYSSAVNYLNTLTVDELSDMQDKMAKAGYFDKIGAQFVRGDHDDEATFKAWESLLMDSWTAKKGIDVTLVEQARTARANKKQLALERWGTSDASRSAIEQAAVEILGRNLDAAEFARVRDTIASLQQDRADDLVGVDSMDWYNDTRSAQGFDQNDVNDKIMREFGGEIAIQNSQDVRQKLKDVYSYSAPNFNEEVS